jgi:ferritin
MLSEKLQNALNKQINAELYSSYLYLSMSAWLEIKNLKGFAHWMRIQAQEEATHILRIMHYMHEKGGCVKLTAVEGPETEWESPLHVFEQALAHEQQVSAMVNALMDVALEERDHATTIMLQWFVTEQVEEEANADEVVQKLILMADAPGGLFMVDQELGQRSFVPPEGTII